MPGYADPATAITTRFRDLAALLTRNATVLEASGLPDEVVALRSTVYRDVAAQLGVLVEVEAEQAAGNPLVVPLHAEDVETVVVRRFTQLADQLTANARVLVKGTSEPVMRRRAQVYRDVASQVRMLARHEADEATARRTRAQRPVSTVLAVVPNQVARQAAARAPRVRAAFLEVLVDAIAKRRRQGWSVARLTLWLRTTLRDPQTDHVHPCARKEFVRYVLALLAGATVPATAGRAVA
ncbi:hypothetical protein DL990_20075 [Amycolatopsis sp. WAC 01416]|uniref:hypothetical protein n=1 Tax=Amycolatopsis sp. WAC 01416 TaxID=2203196 RepID=UPI000F7895FA|nr:hypothetical protein [Amycolatopsis sp. WAC 01416]RSN32219.1 hypothetical protein DL990_20075 [Amycolatopsis sp. WAC 01416]